MKRTVEFTCPVLLGSLARNVTKTCPVLLGSLASKVVEMQTTKVEFKGPVLLGSLVLTACEKHSAKARGRDLISQPHVE